MRSCTLLCDSSRLLIYHKSEPKTPVLLESGVLGILVRAFQVLQHHRTYLLSYTPGYATVTYAQSLLNSSLSPLLERLRVGLLRGRYIQFPKERMDKLLNEYNYHQYVFE